MTGAMWYTVTRKAGDTMDKRHFILTILTISLFALVLLAGCGGNKAPAEGSPSAAADAFLQGIQTGDEEAINAVYAPGDFALNENLQTAEELLGNYEGGDKLLEDLQTKLREFEYTLGEEEVDGDRAIVKVKITTYDFSGAVNDFLTDFVIESSTLKLKGSTDEIGNAAVSLFQEQLDKLTEKEFERETELALTNTDGVWKVDELDQDSEFLNALTGGFVQAITDLAESYSSTQ